MSLLLLIALMSIIACVSLIILLQFAPKNTHNFILGLLMLCTALLFFGLTGAFFLHINCSYQNAMIMAICESIIASILVPVLDDFFRTPPPIKKK